MLFGCRCREGVKNSWLFIVCSPWIHCGCTIKLFCSAGSSDKVPIASHLEMESHRNPISPEWCIKEPSFTRTKQELILFFNYNTDWSFKFLWNKALNSINVMNGWAHNGIQYPAIRPTVHFKHFGLYICGNVSRTGWASTHVLSADATGIYGNVSETHLCKISEACFSGYKRYPSLKYESNNTNANYNSHTLQNCMHMSTGVAQQGHCVKTTNYVFVFFQCIYLDFRLKSSKQTKFNAVGDIIR